MDVVVWITQLGLAAGLGAVVGVERTLGVQAAGLRTHVLVCLGSALFTVAGALAGGDPTRVAAQVVTGIGFLGGGAILRNGLTVRGLTTAASLWVTAAIGLAVGLHEYLGALVTAAFAVVVLRIFKWFAEDLLPQREMIEVTLRLERSASLRAAEEAAQAALPGSKLVRVQYADHGEQLVLVAHPRARQSLAAIGERLLEIPGVEGVDLSR